VSIGRPPLAKGSDAGSFFDVPIYVFGTRRVGDGKPLFRSRITPDRARQFRVSRAKVSIQRMSAAPSQADMISAKRTFRRPRSRAPRRAHIKRSVAFSVRGDAPPARLHLIAIEQIEKEPIDAY